MVTIPRKRILICMLLIAIICTISVSAIVSADLTVVERKKKGNFIEETVIRKEPANELIKLGSMTNIMDAFNKRLPVVCEYEIDKERFRLYARDSAVRIDQKMSIDSRPVTFTSLYKNKRIYQWTVPGTPEGTVIDQGIALDLLGRNWARSTKKYNFYPVDYILKKADNAVCLLSAVPYEKFMLPEQYSWTDIGKIYFQMNGIYRYPTKQVKTKQEWK
ncbi:hypothetical protein GF371_00770 [Candidatus Woesearchaeota archaeon]|nr:hypothetical protein [Candidatus Woesearchaeota archaeon]